jgi:hypothetical protein
MSDYYRDLAYKELRSKQLLEESQLEKKFRDSRGDLLDLAVLEQSLSEVRQRAAAINHMLARCGFSQETENRVKLNEVASLDPDLARIMKGLNECSVDGEFWEYVGEWRKTRLATVEYKFLERGSKKAFSRAVRLPKFERRRRFQEWRREKEKGHYEQKAILSHPRFLVRPPLLRPQHIQVSLLEETSCVDYLDLAVGEDQNVLCTPELKPDGIHWRSKPFEVENKVEFLRIDDIWGGSKGQTFVRGESEARQVPESDYVLSRRVLLAQKARAGRMIVCGSQRECIHALDK